MDLEKLAAGVLAGDTRSISRAISLAEDCADDAFELMKRLFPHTGASHVIGITGPPGAGKSTLTDKLVRLLRGENRRVGVVAVDPTSPFSGGAILGDRVRMNQHFVDPGVFIRSMATRGALGGISHATYDAVTILEASGMDSVLIETVGVGQGEIDIVNTAHTSAVVLVPGLGDGVQAIKAGILEIGDVFIINKADRDGAERLETELGMMLDLAPLTDGWRPPIVKTIASTGEGVEAALAALREHGEFIRGGGVQLKKEIERSRHRILELWREFAMERLLPSLMPEEELRRNAESVARRELEPYSLVERISAGLLGRRGPDAAPSA